MKKNVISHSFYFEELKIFNILLHYFPNLELKIIDLC